MAERSVAIRLAVQGAAEARARLLALGSDGEAALAKLEGRAPKASAALRGLGTAGQQASAGVSSLAQQAAAAVPGLDLFSGQIGQATSGLAMLGPAGVAGAAVAGVGLVAAALAALAAGEAQEAEDSLAKIEGVLNATGQASGRTAGQITSLAEQIGSASKISSEEVEEAAAQLLTFRSISEETFDRTLIAARDLAVLGFGSISSSAAHLGKALEDPETGLTSLRRAGVSFTEAQRDLIKELNETGRVAEAQAEILGVLEQQVGGAGEARGLTLATAQLREEWDQLLESVGSTEAWETAINAIAGLVGSVRQEFAPTLDEARTRLTELEAQFAELQEGRSGLGGILGGLFGDERLLQGQVEAQRELVFELGEEAAARRISEDLAKQAAQTAREEAEADRVAADAKKAKLELDKLAAREQAKADDERAKLAERQGQYLVDLGYEVEQLERLAIAEGESAEAARAATLENLIENEARKAGIDLMTLEGERFATEITLRENLKESIEGSNQARADEASAIKKAGEEKKRLDEKQADEAKRELEREAEATQRLLEAPFLNFLESVQSSTTDVFENIYSGGVTSFSDLFDEAKRLATRFAAEMTSLLIFSPQALMGGAGGFGGLGNFFGGPAAVGGRVAGRGPVSLSEPFTGVPAGQQLGAGGFAPGWSGLGPTLAGVGGGFLLGSGVGGAIGGNQQNAMIGSGLGTAAGAAVGTFLLPGLGTAGGALLGGALGGLAGGFFGGGESDKVKGTLSGGLGQTSGDLGGVGQVIRDFDNQVAQLLTSRQKQQVDQALKKYGSINVNFKGDLTQDVIDFAVGQRAQAAGRGLGFQNIRSAQDIGTALQTQRAVEELNGSVSAFARQIADTSAQFVDLRSQARRFGISIEGLGEAQTKAITEIRRQQDAAVLALLSPFDALANELEAFQEQLQFVGLNPAEQFARAQEEFRRIAAEAEGGSTTALQQIDEAGRLFIQAADAFGASPAAARAQEEVARATREGLAAVRHAQEEASQGFTAAVDRARKDIVDTLEELIGLTRTSLKRPTAI